MTEEAKLAIEAMKQAFDVFEKMELPIKERKCTLEYDSVMAIISGFEQVARERDAAIADLKEELRNQSVISLCENCRCMPDGDYIPNDCMGCVNGCNWQWRGVEANQ